MKKADLADNLLLARKDGFAAADVIGAANGDRGGSSWAWENGNGLKIWSRHAVV